MRAKPGSENVFGARMRPEKLNQGPDGNVAGFFSVEAAPPAFLHRKASGKMPLRHPNVCWAGKFLPVRDNNPDRMARQEGEFLAAQREQPRKSRSPARPLPTGRRISPPGGWIFKCNGKICLRTQAASIFKISLSENSPSCILDTSERN